jgi:hypothetical protein
VNHPDLVIADNGVQWAIRLGGSLNVREHWRARTRRVKLERSLAALCCRSLSKPTQWPVTVKLTRLGPRKLDSDNVQGALKATRDGVADWLGVDDGDESKVLWEYGQEKGAYGVRVEVFNGKADQQ